MMGERKTNPTVRTAVKNTKPTEVKKSVESTKNVQQHSHHQSRYNPEEDPKKRAAKQSVKVKSKNGQPQSHRSHDREDDDTDPKNRQTVILCRTESRHSSFSDEEEESCSRNPNGVRSTTEGALSNNTSLPHRHHHDDAAYDTKTNKATTDIQTKLAKAAADDSSSSRRNNSEKRSKGLDTGAHPTEMASATRSKDEGHAKTSISPMMENDNIAFRKGPVVEDATDAEAPSKAIALEGHDKKKASPSLILETNGKNDTPETTTKNGTLSKTTIEEGHNDNKASSSPIRENNASWSSSCNSSSSSEQPFDRKGNNDATTAGTHDGTKDKRCHPADDGTKPGTPSEPLFATSAEPALERKKERTAIMEPDEITDGNGCDSAAGSEAGTCSDPYVKPVKSMPMMKEPPKAIEADGLSNDKMCPLSEASELGTSDSYATPAKPVAMMKKERTAIEPDGIHYNEQIKTASSGGESDEFEVQDETVMSINIEQCNGEKEDCNNNNSAFVVCAGKQQKGTVDTTTTNSAPSISGTNVKDDSTPPPLSSPQRTERKDGHTDVDVSSGASEAEVKPGSTTQESVATNGSSASIAGEDKNDSIQHEQNQDRVESSQPQTSMTNTASGAVENEDDDSSSSAPSSSPQKMSPIPGQSHSQSPQENESANNPSSQITNSVVLLIRGMTCGGCVKVVDRVLNSFDDVISTDTQLESCKCTIYYSVPRLNLLPILMALDDCGMDTFFLESQTTTNNHVTGIDDTFSSDGSMGGAVCSYKEAILSNSKNPNSQQQGNKIGVIGQPSPLVSSSPLSLMDELRQGTTVLRRYKCSCGCEGCICSDKPVQSDDSGVDVTLAYLCDRLEEKLGTPNLEALFREGGGDSELREKLSRATFPCGCSK